MIQRLFHIGCAIIFAASVVATIMRVPPSHAGGDARGQLVRFLENEGFSVTGVRTLIGDEFIIMARAPACSDPIEVLFLPSIHRISPAAVSTIGNHSDAVLIHAGEVVSSLDATVLVPRWLWRRILVNLHLSPETPWTSIAIAVFPAQGCKSLHLPWNQLSSLLLMVIADGPPEGRYKTSFLIAGSMLP
ncbi:MAG: hypothetical protein O9972_60615 [Burkholderiales bacterium]|nr:hypothetical protein [Burkholderiales bacterium]